MNITIETITPERAVKYLEGNVHNRPIRDSHVDFLAEEIRQGRWKQNGSTIVFNGNTLIDGQHRLWAIVNSGKAITTAVCRGVEEGAFSTIDTGRPRTAGDVLSVMGEKNGPTVATAVRFILDYKADCLFGKSRPPNSAIAEWVENNPTIRTSVETVTSGGHRGTMLISPGVLTGLHFLMAKKDLDLANKLVGGLKEGFAETERSDPFFVLREKLVHQLGNPIRTPSRRSAVYIIKAWNAKRRGERLRVFKFQEGEKVPKIV